MSKRHFYAYEAEVRAITSNPVGVSAMLEEHFRTNMVDGSYAPQVNVHAVIDEIVLHPEATTKFVDEMRAFCLKQALPKPRISGLSV
jgi:hypothetical protein